MNSSRSSFAIAAGISLVVHVALFLTLPRYTVSPPGVAWANNQPAEPMKIVLVPELLPEPLSEEKPPEFEIGETTGKGFAAHEVEAPMEAVAPEADADQAALSLDPAGTGESGTDAAVTQAKGQGSVRGQPGGSPPTIVAEMLAPPTARSLTPFGLNPEIKLPRLAEKLLPDALLPAQPSDSEKEGGGEELAQPVTAPPAPIEPTPPAPPQPMAVAVVEKTQPQPTPTPTPSPSNGGTTTGGTQQPAADPARMSDSESDPFSKLGNVTFSDGALQVRFGRKVKTRKPKLLIAGQIDLLTLQRARVVLKIDIDATGKVTGVEVVKSSGSNEIDQPTRVAVYDWWFEPKKNAAGQPVPDEVQFTIGWR